VKSFALDPYGHMTICVLSHQESYDIRTGSVKEGWEHFLLKVRQRERKQITKCANCRIHSVCSMCPANGELENGDPESPVDFLCEVALGFEVPAHGACDYCNDGIHHSAVKESAQRVASKEIDVGDWRSPQVLLPILNDRPSPTGVGCGGCGGH
jgi:radical SAM protein with 4Fe4S-binding SPASM domain